MPDASLLDKLFTTLAPRYDGKDARGSVCISSRSSCTCSACWRLHTGSSRQQSYRRQRRHGVSHTSHVTRHTSHVTRHTSFLFSRFIEFVDREGELRKVRRLTPSPSSSSSTTTTHPPLLPPAPVSNAYPVSGPHSCRSCRPSPSAPPRAPPTPPPPPPYTFTSDLSPVLESLAIVPVSTRTPLTSLSSIMQALQAARAREAQESNSYFGPLQKAAK